MKTMKEMVDRYMNILKPSQQIAFLTWIEDNQACMYMLNSIWMNRRNAKDEWSVCSTNRAPEWMRRVEISRADDSQKDTSGNCDACRDSRHDGSFDGSYRC